MKTNFITIVLFLSISANSFSQTANIDINNINAQINCARSSFWDIFGSTNARYEVPKGGGVSSIFASGLWMGGLDAGGQLHLAGELYSNGTDYQAGPDSINSAQWNKIWKVNKSDIDAFIADFSDGTINNSIPQSILQWPAKGNPNFPLADSDYAPFVDKNGDGIYNPQNFDYPKIKGDQMLWWIFNDNMLHTESGGKPLQFQIHASAYAFNQPSDTCLNNTLFLSYKIINKSSNVYDSVFVGLFTDIDIGDMADDYIGSIPSLNTFYGYNGDSIDGPAFPVNYGNKPPVQTFTFLNQSMFSFMYFNSFIGPTGNPTSGEQYYYYLQAKWLDNKHLTYGGTGYDPTSTQYTNFFFASEPNDVSVGAWSECSEGNIPYDRRGVGSVGPFTFSPGESKTVDVALITVFPIGNYQPCPKLDLVKKSIVHIDSFYQSIPTGIGTVSSDSKQWAVEIYPNPFNDNAELRIKNVGGIYELQFTIYDLLGRQVKQFNILTMQQFTIDRNGLADGLYFYQVKNDKEVIANGKMVISD